MDDTERLRLAKEALDSGSYDKEIIEQDVDSIWANPISTLERLGLRNLKGKVKLIIIKQKEE